MAQHDPTREELDQAISAFPYLSETDEMDRESAIYWFASDCHSGQWSNLYSVLSTSEYHPGPMMTEPEPDTMEDMLYSHLMHTFPLD